MKNMYLIVLTLILVLIISNVGAAAATELQLPFQGFVEYGIGGRISKNIYKPNDILLNEARLQIEFSKDVNSSSFNFKSDFYKDEYSGKTEISIREANINYSPSQKLEFKIGSQILTWGTGDLVFANDVFPKDWNPFFLGRADEYLKAPITALKTSYFSNFGDFNFVISPKFTPDDYLTGERMSYWDFNGLTGVVFQDARPTKDFKNSEFYFRFSKSIANIETAIYSYKGFMKRPLGFNPSINSVYFPKQAVHGLSCRGQFLNGIANIEAGYYDSIEDRHGTQANIDNSMIKSIIGYEKELYMNLTSAVQYFSEYMLHYNKYKNSLNSLGLPAYKKENHDWITLRLTKLAWQQTLVLSFFGYYSPAESDWYLRPNALYKANDQLSIAAGFNIFGGKYDYTFFGQLEDNTNAYLRIRYAY